MLQHSHKSCGIASEAHYTGNVSSVWRQSKSCRHHLPTGSDELNTESLPAMITTKHILLVEDYPANVLVATTLLEDFGYSYEVATTGDEAISKIKSGTFDAALMDVELGTTMCGFEATRLVRDWEKSASKRRLPIIAMTAHALAGDREKCLGAGMDDYISKPFDADELQSKLHMHVSNVAAA